MSWLQLYTIKLFVISYHPRVWQLCLTLNRLMAFSRGLELDSGWNFYCKSRGGHGREHQGLYLAHGECGINVCSFSAFPFLPTQKFYIFGQRQNLLSLFEIVTLVLCTWSKVSNLFKWKQKQRLLAVSLPRSPAFPCWRISSTVCLVGPDARSQVQGRFLQWGADPALQPGEGRLAYRLPWALQLLGISWYPGFQWWGKPEYSTWKTTNPKGNCDSVALGSWPCSYCVEGVLWVDVCLCRLGDDGV